MNIKQQQNISSTSATLATPGAVSNCLCLSCLPTLTSCSYLQDARLPMGRDGGRRTGESVGVRKHLLHPPGEKRMIRRPKEKEGEVWKVKSGVEEQERAICADN